jgi:hypothetical protein
MPAMSNEDVGLDQKNASKELGTVLDSLREEEVFCEHFSRQFLGVGEGLIVIEDSVLVLSFLHVKYHSIICYREVRTFDWPAIVATDCHVDEVPIIIDVEGARLPLGDACVFIIFVENELILFNWVVQGSPVDVLSPFDELVFKLIWREASILDSELIDGDLVLLLDLDVDLNEIIAKFIGDVVLW